jgi:class 3 adenylate cyclase
MFSDYNVNGLMMEPSADLRLAHVLFIDIVGSSKLLINEQSELLRCLTEIVRSTSQVRDAEAAGKLIRLPTGDGMALAFFTNPDAPVRCALEVSKALKNHPNLLVRMGIHSGPVDEVVDVNQRSNIAGAGITIAQRIMDCGDAGHILLSKRIAEDLAQYTQWRPQLHDLGECDVKHAVKVGIVNLYTGDLGNPALPEKLKREQEIPISASGADWCWGDTAAQIHARRRSTFWRTRLDRWILVYRPSSGAKIDTYSRASGRKKNRCTPVQTLNRRKSGSSVGARNG